MDERVYAFVRTVPPGFVVSYGEVARAIGLPGRARMVGWSLRRLPSDTDVPWHRVVNREGCISILNPEHVPLEQKHRLELEGLRFGIESSSWHILRPNWYHEYDGKVAS